MKILENKNKMGNDLNLSDLLVDIDYQNYFSYEERVDIFNKYGYSTAMRFFTPIYHLTWFIFNQIGCNEETTYGYGHGKTILDTTLLERAKKFLPDSTFKYKLINPNKEYLYFRYLRERNIKTTDGDYVSLDSGVHLWNNKTLPTKDSLSIKIQSYSQNIQRVDIYALVDEWLRYFKYIKN